jgi:hypothetical protein
VTSVGEVLRVLGLLPLVEWRRRRLSLHHAVARARAQGRTQRTRSNDARLRLRRVISAIDARIPGGANCVRRALLEMSLDPSAAGEQLFAGLRAGGGSGSGHAWLASQPVHERYDAVIAV